MWKHSQHNNDERTHFFRKNIPLTLYSKWLRKGYTWYPRWDAPVLRLTAGLKVNMLQRVGFLVCFVLFCFAFWGEEGVVSTSPSDDQPSLRLQSPRTTLWEFKHTNALVSSKSLWISLHVILDLISIFFRLIFLKAQTEILVRCPDQRRLFVKS